MTWANVAGAAVGVVGSALTSDKNGGAGTTTATKEPWAQAAPWIQSQIATGQNLQNQYQTNPFNAQQLGAYGKMGQQTQYMNELIPSLLGQIGQGGVGFDRSNPSARPAAYNFGGTGAGTSSASGAPQGLLSILENPSGAYTSAANPVPSAAPAPAAQPQFVNQMGGAANSMSPVAGTQGAYGSFQYGSQPQPGTQAYKDMSDYFAFGGSDPSNLYGRGAAGLFGSGVGNGGNGSVGGSPGSDGSGGGSAGGNW